MRIAALLHAEMVRELAMLWVVVSSTVEFTPEHSPNETFRVKIVDELIAEFQRQEKRCSCLERPSMRVCDLILGMPSSQARLADRLEEAAGRLQTEQAA
jgi:hypothetical protein